MSKQSDLVSVSQGSGGDPLYIDTTNDRVGVGTTSPTHPLTVVGANETTFDGLGTIRLTGTNAYNSGDAGSGITFTGRFNSNNAETTLGQISCKKANTTDGNYDGVLTFGVRNTLEGVNIERMRIDASGRVTMPYQPAFSAYRTAGSIGVGNNQLFTFNVTVLNVGSHYNASTGRFTAPVSGHYMFTYHMLKRQGGVAATYLRKNGGNTISSANTYTDNGGIVQEQTVGASHIIYLAASDYVEVRVDVSSGDFYGDANSHNIFTGHLIG